MVACRYIPYDYHFLHFLYSVGLELLQSFALVDTLCSWSFSVYLCWVLPPQVPVPCWVVVTRHQNHQNGPLLLSWDPSHASKRSVISSLFRSRLVLPPPFAIILFLIGYPAVVHIPFPNPLLTAFFWSGFLIGYVVYDSTHYFLHFLDRKKHEGGYFHRLQKYHNQHHYGGEHAGFGVSSKFWDIVLRSDYKSQRVKKAWFEDIIKLLIILFNNYLLYLNENDLILLDGWMNNNNNVRPYSSDSSIFLACFSYYQLHFILIHNQLLHISRSSLQCLLHVRSQCKYELQSIMPRLI